MYKNSKKILSIFLTLIIFTNNVKCMKRALFDNPLINFAGDALKKGGELVGDAVDAGARAVRDQMRENREKAERQIKKLEEERKEIEIKVDTAPKDTPKEKFEIWGKQISELNAKIAQFETTALENIKDEQEFTKKGGALINKAGDKGLDLLNQFATAQIEQQKIAVQEAMRNKAAMDRLKEILNFAQDPKKLSKIALYITIAAIGISGAYFGGKLAFGYLEQKLMQPRLIQKTSIKSVKEQITDFILGKKPIPSRFNEITLEPELEFEIKEITESLEDAIANGEDVYHVLLTGPAGTGKTMFSMALATRLAQKSIMYKGKRVPVNYMMCAGSDFSQLRNGKDIEEFHKIVDYANNAEGITILFIDEIDSLLKSRNDPKASEESINRVSAFLTTFDKPTHPKIMIIGGTNFEHKIDRAAFTRFSKKVRFKLPSGEILAKLFDQYLKKEVLTKKKMVDQSFIDGRQKLINSMQGLSPRTIEEVMKQAFRRLRFMKTDVLTYEIMKKLIDAAQEAERRNLALEAGASIQQAAEAAASAVTTPAA